ncbi:unnamed protein product [Prorocentrum cordatum]|uniref:Peptidase C1A papain C-terminal domain-containing protein n=1 Tax=Prorocentrum cordatum TaxID=2364126 RepID=A0ABN9YD61_9DINO|nr:unnamed protein product [Polarella glacialis]
MQARVLLPRTARGAVRSLSILLAIGARGADGVQRGPAATGPVEPASEPLYDAFRRRHWADEDAGRDHVGRAVRASLFQARSAEVAAHNARPGVSWKKAVNKFSDRTDSELRGMLGRVRGGGRPRGFSPSPAASVGSLLQVRHSGGGRAASVDWRDRLNTSRSFVHDQGSCGSCWAVAAVGALEMHAEALHGRTVRLSYEVPAFGPIVCSNPALFFHCEGVARAPRQNLRPESEPRAPSLSVEIGLPVNASKEIDARIESPMNARQGRGKMPKGPLVRQKSCCLADRAGLSMSAVESVAAARLPRGAGRRARWATRPGGEVVPRKARAPEAMVPEAFAAETTGDESAAADITFALRSHGVFPVDSGAAGAGRAPAQSDGDVGVVGDPGNVSVAVIDGCAFLAGEERVFSARRLTSEPVAPAQLKVKLRGALARKQ